MSPGGIGSCEKAKVQANAGGIVTNLTRFPTPLVRFPGAGGVPLLLEQDVGAIFAFGSKHAAFVAL